MRKNGDTVTSNEGRADNGLSMSRLGLSPRPIMEGICNELDICDGESKRLKQISKMATVPFFSLPRVPEQRLWWGERTTDLGR